MTVGLFSYMWNQFINQKRKKDEHKTSGLDFDWLTLCSPCNLQELLCFAKNIHYTDCLNYEHYYVHLLKTRITFVFVKLNRIYEIVQFILKLYSWTLLYYQLNKWLCNVTGFAHSDKTTEKFYLLLYVIPKSAVSLSSMLLFSLF